MNNEMLGQGPLDEKGNLEAPRGFISNPIAQPRIEGAVKEPQPSPPSPDASMDRDLEAQTAFIASVHQYIRENIQFVDQKAAFFATGSTALLAFLYSEGTASAWLKHPMKWNLLDLAAFVAMVSLAIGVVLALLTVRPRLPGSRRGLVFWEAVAEHDSGRQYADEIARRSAATLTQSVAEHCFDLAVVCRTKHKFLRWSVHFSSVGLLAALLVFMFNKSQDVPATPQLRAPAAQEQGKAPAGERERQPDQ